MTWLLLELLGPAGFEEECVALYDGEQYLPEIVWLADALPETAAPPHELSFERTDYLQMLHFGATLLDMILWQILP